MQATISPSRTIGCLQAIIRPVSVSQVWASVRCGGRRPGPRKEPGGLLFVGEKGAPFRRSTFGRKWRRARTKAEKAAPR
ncbi:hypothetical protein [Streptomyces niveus]|uniref:hypothetical protein n=1 Tax=Streptomyces niveus TaxID=193462 RepID=UPI0034054C6E